MSQSHIANHLCGPGLHQPPYSFVFNHLISSRQWDKHSEKSANGNGLSLRTSLSRFPSFSLHYLPWAAVLPMSVLSSKRSSGWYSRLAAFNVEDLFDSKREPGPPRKVFVNQDLPQDYYDHRARVKKEAIYTSNQVITSKYTIFTFVPRNLLEQFRRIANMWVFSLCSVTQPL